MTYTGPGDRISPFTGARAEAVAAELQAIADEFGVFPDPTDLVEGRLPLVTPGGTGNALTAALTGLASYVEGLTFRVRVPLINTSSVSLNINGIGTKALLDPAGLALAAGAMVPGSIVQIVYDGTAFRILGNGPAVQPGSQRASLLTAAAYRLLAAKLADRFDIRDVAGVDITGNNDSTTSAQKAVTQAIADKAPLYTPTGAILVATAPINITGPLEIIGMARGGGQSYSDKPVPTAARFHFAHAGKGFYIHSSSGTISGVALRQIMTSRVQTEPTNTAWTSGGQDFDIDILDATDIDLSTMMIFNASKGINILNAARVNISGLNMQAFDMGVVADVIGDVVRFTDIHIWPFWRNHIEVHRYALEHLDALWLKRVDGPYIDNFFSIGHRSGIRFSNSTYVSGGVTQMQAGKVGLDYGKRGLWFDSTANNNSIEGIDHLRFVGGVASAGIFPETADRAGILVEGSGIFLSVDDFSTAYSSGSAISVTGTGCDLRVTGTPWVLNYGTAGGNTDPAFALASGNRLTIASPIRNSSPGAGPLFGGSGVIDAPDRIPFTPSLSSQGGALSNAGFAGCYYRRCGNKVSGEGVLTIVAAGTATGYLRIGMPVVGDHTFIGSAVDIAISTGLPAIGIPGSPTYLQITKDAGTTAIANGAQIAFTFEYLVS